MEIHINLIYGCRLTTATDESASRTAGVNCVLLDTQARETSQVETVRRETRRSKLEDVKEKVCRAFQLKTEE